MYLRTRYVQNHFWFWCMSNSNKSLCELLVKKKPPKNMLTHTVLRESTIMTTTATAVATTSTTFN